MRAKLSKPPLLFAIFLICLFTNRLTLANTDTMTPSDTTPSTTQQLEPISLQLKWQNQFQFAGYYAAKIKGYYAAEGLDVTIKPRDPFKNNIQQVIDGESEYGIADSMMMLYQAKGAPITIVAPIFQHSPQVIITLKSSGIDSLFDLTGKNIAFYQKDTDGFPLLAMMKHNHITPNLDRMIIKAGPDMLTKGQIQAYPAYLSNEPYFFYKNGIEINIFHPMNYGVDLYGDLIFTHNDELKNHPERVLAFKRASIKGWDYALKHKEEIINYLINELKVNKSYEHLMYEARVIEEAIQPNTMPIGTLDKGRLDFIHRLFVDHQLIDKDFDVSKGIYQKEVHRLTLTEKETAWIREHPVVHVAVDNNWAPIEFVDNKGQYTGIANEYFIYLKSLTGIEFKPAAELSWQEAVQQVKDNKLDMYSAVINTPERGRYVNFTQPYLNFPMVIATQKGENFIKDLSTLSDKTIAVVDGYAAHELLKTHFPKLNLYLVDNPQKGLEAVSQGLAYGYVDNVAVIGYLIRSTGLPNLQISGETPFKADVSMAIRKDWPELHSILNKALASIDSQTQTKLNNPWLQVDYKQEIEWNRVFLILTPIVIGLLIILLYNRKLRNLNQQLTTSNKQLVNTQKTLEITNDKLAQLNITDFLTGAYNRSHIDHILNTEINRSNRQLSPVSIMLIDLDNFKKINDTYGHLTGDEVLKAISHDIKQHIRSSDTFGRWGGEEFMLICPATDSQQAQVIADKVLHSVKKIGFREGFTQTLSIGVATYSLDEPLLKFVARADDALYQAKNTGKDKVVSAESLQELPEFE
ncbi:hypothetical protein THMIRHAM_18900 [Thiomicrorhabdus immobilis]|uniref:diguanylate cyclase n=1 Tax=Thiomicrorhabdus immobilis TaxID=2791037 RepID=A0ABN6CY94_9GAMM|nr:ABC transporter substrate-binding protein [Thiomicrorhabdus immobilis]BCN94105.1 hypothetical protein THMIRHAM_18900 [Thiomicrorhabdus immobilis]